MGNNMPLVWCIRCVKKTHPDTGHPISDKGLKTDTFRPGARTTAGFRPQDCGYVGIWASFVTYVRLALNFPGEGGQIAKKWSENDPLVVGRSGSGRRNNLDRTLPHFQWERNSKLC